MRAVHDFTPETFHPRVGEQFRLMLETGQTLELRLDEVTEGAQALRRQFSIVFTGPLEPLLPQRIYAFEHDKLGSFELFIVPIGQDEAGTQYEAVFA